MLVECWREGLYLQGIVHDLSKFHPEEFVPYALKFYADRKDEQTELRWQYAWLRHQNRNKHHWEHWVVNKQTREALPMPRKYIIEMVCDWRSFSRKWGRKVKASGLLERILKSDSIILHPATRQELNDYIQSQAHASR